jgi:hypothetical protein
LFPDTYGWSGLNEIFIGEIIGTNTEERFLTDGKMNLEK